MQHTVQLHGIACLGGDAGQVTLLGRVGEIELLFELVIQLQQILQAIEEVETIVE